MAFRTPSKPEGRYALGCFFKVKFLGLNFSTIYAQNDRLLLSSLIHSKFCSSLPGFIIILMFTFSFLHSLSLHRIVHLFSFRPSRSSSFPPTYWTPLGIFINPSIFRSSDTAYQINLLFSMYLKTSLSTTIFFRICLLVILFLLISP